MKKLLLILFSLPILCFSQVKINDYDTTSYHIQPLGYEYYYKPQEYKYFGWMLFGTTCVSAYTFYRVYYYNDPIIYFQLIPPLTIEYILIKKLIQKKKNSK